MVNNIEWDVKSYRYIWMKDLEAVDDKRQKAYDNAETYQEQAMKAYNKYVQPRGI